MKVTAFKTPKVTPGQDLLSIVDHNLPKLEDKSIVVVTSKIVSLCQNRVVKNDGTVSKKDLVKQESQFYIPSDDKWDLLLTITDNTLIPSGGIDESNGNNYFILWPDKVEEQASLLWNHLRDTNKIENLGVIIVDSHTTPLRWGTSGIGIAWCGFEPLKNYIGKPDIFGRNLHVTKQSILDGLAASAVVTMGEGNEQTPLAVITDVSFVTFQTNPPSKQNIAALKISQQEDIYGPIISAAPWKRGNKK